MLVLSRQRDECVIITLPAGYVVPAGGLRAVVMPVDIRGDKVRLGFDGPEEMQFNRAEVQDRIDAEKPRQPRNKNREHDL